MQRAIRGVRVTVLSAALAAAAPACDRNEPRGGAANARDGGADARVPVAEPVEFRTADGWSVRGSWLAGSATTVVLVHQLGANRSEWEPLVNELRGAASPPTVLTIDLRGHGESTSGPNGVQTRWAAFENSPTRWAGLRADVAAAVAYARSRRGDAAVVLVGSSVGSTAAVAYAAEDPGVRGLVLLSPGLSYRGVDALAPARAYVSAGRPMMLVAAQGDAVSADAVVQMAQATTGASAAPAAVTRQVYADTGAHGTALGAAGVHPELWPAISRWIRELPTGAR